MGGGGGEGFRKGWGGLEGEWVPHIEDDQGMYNRFN